MAQYDLIFIKNTAASGIQFSETTLAKPGASGYFLTQNPSTGAISWSKTQESPVINGTITGTAIVDIASASAGKIADAASVKSYVDSLIGANDAMVYKGGIDCSANPNYPAAEAGWTYKVTAAGKIGGASGVNVEIGDTIICSVDNAGGTQATVGSSFNILQSNIDGAILDGMFSSTGLMKRTGTNTYAIVTDYSSNWNTAYSWGNHAGLYSLLSHNHAGVYEPVFTKNTAFNKNFGTASGTVAQGDDSRITHGETAYGWGNHAGLYAALSHTHSAATTSVAGFMSATDKTKLDGIATNANNYSLPTATATVLGGVKIGSRITISSGVISADVQSDNNFTTTYKNKLDGIEASANNYSHPTGDGNLHVPATSTTNNTKVLKAGSTAGSISWGVVAWTEISGKPSTFTPSTHTHTTSQITGLDTWMSQTETAIAQFQSDLNGKMDEWAIKPTTPTSSGVAGAIAQDDNYIYVCIATNTWRRAAIAAWE